MRSFLDFMTMEHTMSAVMEVQFIYMTKTIRN